ncbi:hypothetical protein VOLCADRAFT_104835 [Volvox carteri f. nagariensis]|uniref:Pherophorin domain-containing protein n=1 Tax=Volvox carteri f. nagariensis TaxID=3068 RepID=D8TWD8_VOLCA|nr:uncharacterized protein VOLCADRAFT_104835 [Volvox carteri f. nagariensis]EFJ48138.1 hypothetical protein VOLCADRAFT_104835 [Volvox carteri f. nagariensis]|eukprot:XP_002950823.1 hypothetical protein VOLCADRAFT_104835 [Volvox carteri f. nagariensis]
MVYWINLLRLSRLTLLLEHNPNVQLWERDNTHHEDPHFSQMEHPDIYSCFRPAAPPAAYVKRVADFEPIPLPRKRPTATPGQDTPRPATTGRIGIARPVVTPLASPNTPATATQAHQPQEPAAPGAPPPERTAATGGTVPAQRGIASTEPRLRRRVAESGSRTDPIPADPQEEERRIAEDIIHKVNKYALPLGTTLRCNPISIYTKRLAGGPAIIHPRATPGRPMADRIPTQGLTPSPSPSLSSSSKESDSDPKCKGSYVSSTVNGKFTNKFKLEVDTANNTALKGTDFNMNASQIMQMTWCITFRAPCSTLEQLCGNQSSCKYVECVLCTNICTDIAV